MNFSSPIFLFLFLPLALLLYFFPVPPRWKASWRNLVLIASSLLFYFWGEGIYVSVLLASVLLSWSFALLVERSTDRMRPFALAAGVLSNVVLLFYFKYFALLRNASEPESAPMEIHLPIGISFFTFQAVSYLVDVYRRDVRAQRSLAKVLLYKSFFPQLIAGPIVRYRDIERDIRQRDVSLANFSLGVERFIIGLAQKLIIANSVGAVADQIYSQPLSAVSTPLAWIAAISYTLQIYYDFSGYSNMAIGLGRMFGFCFLENFNFPYSSTSITEFWRRWHISLSSWFRDYVYIPLGGNRSGVLRTQFNLALVFLLCGFWHGASWNFLFWGAYHGVFLMLERGRIATLLATAPKILSRTYTLSVLLIGWIFFRVESLPDAFVFIGKMFGIANVPETRIMSRQMLTPAFVAISIVAVYFSFPRRWTLPFFEQERKPIRFAFAVAEFAIFIVSLSFLASGSYNPFIYFRF